MTTKPEETMRGCKTVRAHPFVLMLGADCHSHQRSSSVGSVRTRIRLKPTVVFSPYPFFIPDPPFRGTDAAVEN